MRKMTKKILSIVVPSYNEEENIPLMYEEIIKNINQKKFDYEIIYVNDGSVDQTWSAINKLSKKDKNVKGINFSRNFGHHAALEAGLLESKGDIIIMMDADLQHPPTLIPKLIEKYNEGYDVVNTVRLSTEGVGKLKKASSKLFYSVLNGLSSLDMQEGEADYRLLSRRALDVINNLPETPKFYRGLSNWIGFDVAKIEYEAANRIHGQSSYSLKKMMELARIGLTSFSMRPLKLIIGLGASLMVLSALFLVAMIIVKLFIAPEYFSNNAILVMFLVFITGMLATLQGVMAMYMVDIHSATKGRPTYIIKNITGGDKSEE